MTPEEAKEHAWLNELPTTERSEIERTWQLAELGRGEEPTAAAVSEAWAVVERRMDDSRVRSLDRPPLRRALHLVSNPFVVRWAAVAAVIVIAVGIVLWTRPITIEAGAGEVSEFVLPDGSDVTLSSGSSITYKRGFRGSTRIVSLNGEAFFDVVRLDTPFIVGTFNATVEVLGTQFNVRAWAGDARPETEVTLQEGTVRFSSLAPSLNSVLLAPGQYSALHAGATQPTDPVSIDAVRIASWRNGGFTFNNKPLTTILAEVQRRYNIQIRISDELKDDSLVLFHDRPENVEVILDAICVFKGCRYRVTSSGYELVR